MLRHHWTDGKPSPLPICSGCGERAIHGSVEECCQCLRAAIHMLRGQAARAVVLPPVQRIAPGVSGWD